MKMKYALCAVIFAAALLPGCKRGLVCENGVTVIENANITLSVPEDWRVTTGDAVYEEMYEAVSDEYGSVKELKSSFEDSGERLLLNARSADGAVGVLFSETDRGDVSAADVLRSVHDTSIFDFRSSGFFTESSFEEYDWGGVEGVLSDIKVSEEKGKPAVLEEKEFCFERGELAFSLKIHITGGSGQAADDVKLSANK